MHSSLPQQLTNFAFSGSPLIRRVFLAIERLMIRRSRVVIVICPALEDTVRAIDPQAQVVLIENAPGSAEEQATPDEAAAVRAVVRVSTPRTPLVLYTGTFEAYQGLDLLFAAMALVRAERPDARLLLAGGKPDQVERARAEARAAGIDDVDDLRRRAAGRRDSGVSAGLRRARLAAVARHEHAAQDLSVSAIGEADCRDPAADAHAGAQRRHRDSDGSLAA